jgi:hypothetical protein
VPSCQRLTGPCFHFVRRRGNWIIIIKICINRKSTALMRTSLRWIRIPHVLPHATSCPQLSCHVRFRFSQHPCTILAISPSSDIETRRIRMRWHGDDAAVMLVLVPAPEVSWIMLCGHDKLLRHIFGEFSRVSCRALSPGWGRPLVAP